MLRTVIVDDELDARKNTINIVNTYCDNIELVATAENVQQGISKIKEHNPDLVLLDVDMPDGTGFDLLSELMPVSFMVIFITGFSEHAVKAIKYNALDYLVKPLDAEELLLAVNKAGVSQKEKLRNQKLENLLNEIDKPEDLRIAITTADNIHFVSPDEIVRIEADANYSHIFLNDETKITVSKPLKEYADMLDGPGFFRSHQSHLVNLKFVKKYNKRDGGSIILTNKQMIPISTRKKEKLLEAIKNYKA